VRFTLKYYGDELDEQFDDEPELVVVVEVTCNTQGNARRILLERFDWWAMRRMEPAASATTTRLNALRYVDEYIATFIERDSPGDRRAQR
jgi:hypothetical protein